MTNGLQRRRLLRRVTVRRSTPSGRPWPPRVAQRSKVVRCRHFLRQPATLGRQLARLRLQPYTNAPEDVDEHGEADGLFQQRMAQLRQRLLRLARVVDRRQGGRGLEAAWICCWEIHYDWGI
eukprot:s1487_g5.t1